MLCKCRTVNCVVVILVSCCKLKIWPNSCANVLPEEPVERPASCTTPTDALPHMVFRKAIPTVLALRSCPLLWWVYVYMMSSTSECVCNKWATYVKSIRASCGCDTLLLYVRMRFSMVLGSATTAILSPLVHVMTWTTTTRTRNGLNICIIYKYMFIYTA